jgi:hypothetical protein
LTLFNNVTGNITLLLLATDPDPLQLMSYPLPKALNVGVEAFYYLSISKETIEVYGVIFLLNLF